MKYGKEMPKIHITDLLKKDTLNVPLSNKKNIANLPTLNSKRKKRFKIIFTFPKSIEEFSWRKEQFSIGIRNSEIILSGGMSTNKKNLSIWSLDIQKLEWEKIY